MSEKTEKNGQITVTVTSPENEERSADVSVQDVEESDSAAPQKVEVEEIRKGWGNKMEYILATIGFAVGLGNVW